MLTTKEKEKKVIEMLEKGCTYNQIAKELHVSLSFIASIKKKLTGENKSLSRASQAFKMFKDGLPLEDVAIELDIETPAVLCYYQDYFKLVNMGRLVTIYKEIKDDLPLFLRLYRRLKRRV